MVYFLIPLIKDSRRIGGRFLIHDSDQRGIMGSGGSRYDHGVVITGSVLK